MSLLCCKTISFLPSVAVSLSLLSCSLLLYIHEINPGCPSLIAAPFPLSNIAAARSGFHLICLHIFSCAFYMGMFQADGLTDYSALDLSINYWAVQLLNRRRGRRRHEQFLDVTRPAIWKRNRNRLALRSIYGLQNIVKNCAPGHDCSWHESVTTLTDWQTNEPTNCKEITLSRS
jgi:hypothetical protein